MKNLILYIVKNLVKHPENVFIESQQKGEKIIFAIKVNEEDKAVLIGANGKTISAIKDILRVQAKHQKFEIKVVE